MNLPATDSRRIQGRKWQSIRVKIFRRDGYLCVPCKAAGRITPAIEVDHVVSLEAGGNNALENLQSICGPCHQAKTRLEAKDGPGASPLPWFLAKNPERVVETISGPPFSLRREHVDEIAGPSAKIVDLDQCARHVCGDWCFHSGMTIEQKRAAYRFRNGELRMYLEGDSFEHCYNIVAAPSFKERRFWQELGPVTVVEFDLDQCVRRAERDLIGRDELPAVIKDIRAWQ